jgi:hypothetical protein
MVLSIEERVFLVEYVYREGNRYTDLVQEQFAEKFPMLLVHLLRNFVKQAWCWTPNEVGDHLNLTISS